MKTGTFMDVVELSSNLIDVTQVTEVYEVASETLANQVVKFAQNQTEMYDLKTYAVTKKVKHEDEYWVVKLTKTMKRAGENYGE